MTARRFRVGIVGLKPEQSWSARAHVPALLSLRDHFEIAGVANSSRSSAEAAAAACGLARAFDSVDDLVASPDVDIVAVTVKVPHHRELVAKSLLAGKHVYCEWPLGNGLAETEELAALAREKRLLGVIGTQARVSPAIEHLRRLVTDGFVGEVLSSTIMARGRSWGATIDSEGHRGYLLDPANGATMLTIPMAHTLAALRDVLGDVVELTSYVENRRKRVRTDDTGDVLSMSAPDQIFVSGLLASGAPVSVCYRGGLPRDGMGFIWEIVGSDGEIRVTAEQGNTQMVRLTIQGANGDDRALHTLEPGTASRADLLDDIVAGNVARLYRRMAHDLLNGTSTAPTFDDAVALHRVLASIEQAAVERGRVALPVSNRLLPPLPA